jgi:hypothetical protein
MLAREWGGVPRRMKRRGLAVILTLALAALGAASGVGEDALEGDLMLAPPASMVTSTGAISFDDTTQAAGFTSTDPALDPLKGAYIHAAAWGDVDNDGDPDLFVGTFTDSSISYYQKRGATGPLGDQLFMNDGDGTFSPAGQPALNLFGRAAGAAFADLDNDGLNDLIVSNNSYPTGTTTNAYKLEPNHLFHNAGNGQFVDVSGGSGIAPAGFASGRAVGVLDYDGDGCLDVFIVADQFHGNLSSSRLLRGDCGLHFDDVTASAGLDVTGALLVQGLGVAIGDVNNDGWPDIFVAGGPVGFERRNFLFVNRTDGTFREASNGAFDEPPGIIDAAEDWTSGASFGDLNRDGLMDLVIGHHYGSADQASYGANAEAFAPTVWLNTSTDTGDPTFANVTAGSGVVPIRAKAPHVEIQDFDNDGWPDISVSVVAGLPTGAQPLVFRSEGESGQVSEHPTFSAPAFDPATLHYYPGGPAADYDRDGRLDLFLDEFRPTDVPPLFRNTSESADHGWLDVRASSPDNLGGIGARVSVFEAGQLGEPSALIGSQDIQVGNGFSSAGLPLAHFGLGSRAAVDVAVTIPFGGGTITRTGVTANQLVTFSTDPLPGVPLSISNVVATAGNGQASVTWSAPSSDGGSPVTGYTVTASPGGQTASVNGSTLTADVSALSNGTSYTFTVVATNANGDSGPPASSNAVTPRTVPGAPTNVVATAGNQSASVTWSAPSSDGGSAITRYTVIASPGGQIVTTNGARNADVTGLTNGTSYVLTVVATNAAGDGPPSAASNAVTPYVVTVPTAPLNVVATAGNASATVTWTAPISNGGSPITGYTVTSNVGGFSATVDGSTLSTVITGLTNGTSYRFRVVATNAIGSGALSAQSNAVVPRTVPGAPTNVTATAGIASATVSWTPPFNGGSAITGYTVIAAPGGATKSVAASLTTTTFTGLTNGTTYTFTVVAKNVAGSGVPSAPSNAVTPRGVPGAPTNVVATAGNASATVTWAAPASNGGSLITGYTVTSSVGGFSATVDGSTLSTVITGLTNGTSYRFRVVATNAIGNGAKSALSNAVVPKVPPGASSM